MLCTAIQTILSACTLSAARLLTAQASAHQSGEGFISSEKDKLITVLDCKARQQIGSILGADDKELPCTLSG